MKFPKNRDNVFVVMREDEVVTGVFSELQAADDYAGACAQEFKEKTGITVKFNVIISTFYG